MTEQNNMPDVLFVDPDMIHIGEINTHMYLADEEPGDDDLLYCNRLLAGITAYRGTMGAKAARWEHEAGRLLGYVILPL